MNGKQTYTYRSVPLNEAVQPLRDAGVRVIVIGVGNVSANQLRSVTENPRDVYLIPNFDILLSQVDTFKRIICEGRTNVRVLLYYSARYTDEPYILNRFHVRFLRRF